MIETARAFEWLYSILSTDSILNQVVEGRVYRYLAPEGSEMPYIILQFQGGHDVQTVGAFRIMSQLVCVVKAVGLTGDYSTLRTVVDRVDTLLHMAEGETGDSRILSCTREFPIDYEEVAHGKRYQHLGGQYRLYIQSV